MQYGHIAGIDKPISRIIQGGMMLIPPEDNPSWPFDLLDEVYATGVNAFDLAYVYGGGVCERTMGAWMAMRGNRDDVVVVGKGCHHDAGGKRVNPACIAHDIATELERLQTGYIDLWMFHRDDPEQPVGPLVDECNRQLEAGRIHAYGGSNWPLERIQEANAYAAAHGLRGFACTSPNYSLARQLASPWGDDCLTISGPEHRAEREELAGMRLPVLTWSSLARGFLSGKITRANVAAVRADFEELVFRCYESEDNWERLARAEQIAARTGSTVAQVALAFVLNQRLEAYALVAAYAREEAQANAAALDLVLSSDDLAWLDLEERNEP
jgi:aryl-alcohol dehydrogenase-like predicted oxidoreductase